MQSSDQQEGGGFRARIQWIGLIAGPCLALFCWFVLPDEFKNADGAMTDFSSAGRATLCVMAWMAVWWLTEAIEISVTALLPLVMFPLLGVANLSATSSPYAHPLIFLFMGGFLLALSMRRWGLGRRIALLTLSAVGTKPTRMVAGFMVTTAVLSAFVSNTATTAMMLPIAISVIELVDRNRDGESANDNFALALLLGIAYAASIGGIATIIGSPPNAFLVGFIDKMPQPHAREIDFVQWMMIGVPLAAVFLPIAWILLTRVLHPVGSIQIKGGRELIGNELNKIGPANRGEWATFVVFMVTALCWMTRPWLTKVSIGDWQPLAGLKDGGIAMAGGLLLFVIPVNIRKREFVMNWDTAKGLPWGILLLFGGGLTLAAAVKANGVAEFIGAQATYLSGVNMIAVVLAVTTVVIFMTELTSNTATTATLVPVLAALAPGLDVHPFMLIFPAALAASCAFMMPVATPPNAIVFGSGRVTIPQMCRAGLWLNLIGIALVTLASMLIMRAVLM